MASYTAGPMGGRLTEDLEWFLAVVRKWRGRLTLARVCAPVKPRVPTVTRQTRVNPRTWGAQRALGFPGLCEQLEVLCLNCSYFQDIWKLLALISKNWRHGKFHNPWNFLRKRICSHFCHGIMLKTFPEYSGVGCFMWQKLFKIKILFLEQLCMKTGWQIWNLVFYPMGIKMWRSFESSHWQTCCSKGLKTVTKANILYHNRPKWMPKFFLLKNYINAI